MSWTCPHCNKTQIIVDANFDIDVIRLEIGDTNIGQIGYKILGIRCLNTECQEPVINLTVGKASWNNRASKFEIDDGLFDGRIYPLSSAIPQPDYIPQQIAQDYYEACKIVSLSPKASATLSRRCIQGIIRDFANIQAKNLFQEIEALRRAIGDGTADRSISEESVEALHAVRSIGNIGAHMEADVNHIVDVDPDEADVLIKLIEQLFVDWYGARAKRQERLSRITEIAAEKAAARLPKDVTA